MTSSRLSYCAKEARRFDRDRFICAAFAPESRREAIWAILALNAELARVPERVREPMLRAIRFAWWRERIDDVFAGRAVGHAVLQSLAGAVWQHGLQRHHFDDLIEGRARDVDDEPGPRSIDDLIAYVETTSSTVTRLILSVLGADRPADATAGGHLGLAWGLIGLMRAVPFHAGQGRSYLPPDLYRRGLPLSPPAAGYDAGRSLCAAVERITIVAAEHLRSARALRSQVSPSALPALLPAALADGYLKQLRRAGYDPFDPRLRAPAAGQLIRLAVARARRRF